MGPERVERFRAAVDGERSFALVAVVAVVGALALGTVGGTGTAGADSRSVAFEQSAPDEYDFELPARGGTATVDGETFESLPAALSAAQTGDRVELRGRFDDTVNVTTPGITLVGAGDEPALLNGNGSGDVLTIGASDVTVRHVWVRNSGFDPAGNDAGIWVDGAGAEIVDARITEATFGVWVDGVDGVRVANTTVVGRERVRPLSSRGNGIQLWRTSDTVVADNRITDVRDGVYFSWAENVTARDNAMWDLRYGVHYMYSDDCRLLDNVAVGNDVGYALMVSEELVIANNTAVDNHGQSGHGIMLKSVDETTIRGNHLVDNGKGLYVYNSLDNEVLDNLVLENDLGVHLTAGSVRERVAGNSFLRNDAGVKAVIGQQVAWNATGEGNYWGSATTADLDGDGVSEVRHQPSGLVDRILREHPRAEVFANSPAFRSVRIAESTVPVVASPGVVDHHPLVASPHDWRRYYASDND
jgi:nitrous oxidase accessory protein